VSAEAGAPAGLVHVDKPAGLTSHDVVARVRRLARTRRVGHAGTLDPMATGVLVLGVGRATRLLGHLTLTEKAYDATIRLGAETTTDDAEGELLRTGDCSGLTEDAVRATLAGFVGDLQQVPSRVSAVKVDGRRAHERVRAGEEVDLPARPVTVHELTVHEVRPGQWWEADVSLRCSSGTYVRAVARDAGRQLGVGGHLSTLRRTSVGHVGLDQTHTLDALERELAVLPLAEAARAAFPALDVDDAAAAAVRHGRPLARDLDGLTALFAPDGTFLALYEPRDGVARAVAVLA
jgi:tRNA pseudouridine55 synthase